MGKATLGLFITDSITEWLDPTALALQLLLPRQVILHGACLSVVHALHHKERNRDTSPFDAGPVQNMKCRMCYVL